MPSVSHESLVDLFRDCPALAPELLRRATKAKLPAGTTARITSAEFTDLDAAEYRSDVVVRLDDGNSRAKEAIIVEIQLDRDPDKRYSWPMYVTGVRARLRCQTALLVIAIDASIAAWCAKQIPLGRGGSVVCPIVVGPAELPRITDLGRAREFPELAVLTAAAHGEEEDSAEIALAALGACDGLDTRRCTRYSDFVWASLGEAARRALESLMNQREYEYQSDFVRKYVQQGREEGERAIVSRLLARRFGPLPSAALECVQQADLSTLDRWAERLLTAETLDEVLSS